MQLTDREWKEFYLSGKNGIFENYHGKRLIKERRMNGKIPMLTAGENNQGLTTFISNSNMPIFKDFISIDMFGNAFYHEHICSGDDNIYFFINNNLSKYIKLFIVNCINKNKSKYSYGKQFRQGNADNNKIMLPVKKEDSKKPDYTFMEAYVKEQETKKKQEYLKYAKKVIDNLEYKEIPVLEEKEWGEFFVSNICNIESGQDIYDAERISGKTPYITSTASNNGIKYFVENCNRTLEAGAISVNRNGSVGYCFYHKYHAMYSNDCRKLRLVIGKNEFVSLFVTNQITQQREKYNYGYKMGTGRLKRQKILLPIDKSNQADCEYMEQYIKNIMYLKLKEYISFIK